MIIGGALGNFYDRIQYKAVPDFIDFHYNNFHWFTFNVADVFISVGVMLLIFYELTKKEKKCLKNIFNFFCFNYFIKLFGHERDFKS